MTTTESRYRTTINIGNAEVEMFTGGSGPALMFLHGTGGNLGWQPFHEELSRNYAVYVPSQPGFNGTPRHNWVDTINDVCHFNLEMAQKLGLDQYILMGASMGGWVAAEMAAMCHHNLKGLILVDAAGIKPEKGEIAEIFMVSAQTRLKQRFYDPSQVPNYEQYTRELTPEEQQVEHSNREMARRLCWRPYLHTPAYAIIWVKSPP
jgi:pimeloyl-ACP methyl ester carboxylesterase